MRNDMTTKNATALAWEALRTDESRAVEDLLRKHFENADAYRYNSASIRVRIIDSKFRDLTHEERDDRVEPWLAQLDPKTQADIMSLVLLYPGEVDESSRAFINNEEFEHPSQSML
jgi:hypothetical protein